MAFIVMNQLIDFASHCCPFDPLCWFSVNIKRINQEWRNRRRTKPTSEKKNSHKIAREKKREIFEFRFDYLTTSKCERQILREQKKTTTKIYANFMIKNTLVCAFDCGSIAIKHKTRKTNDENPNGPTIIIRQSFVTLRKERKIEKKKTAFVTVEEKLFRK